MHEINVRELAGSDFGDFIEVKGLVDLVNHLLKLGRRWLVDFDRDLLSSLSCIKIPVMDSDSWRNRTFDSLNWADIKDLRNRLVESNRFSLFVNLCPDGVFFVNTTTQFSFIRVASRILALN